VNTPVCMDASLCLRLLPTCLGASLCLPACVPVCECVWCVPASAKLSAFISSLPHVCAMFEVHRCPSLALFNGCVHRIGVRVVACVCPVVNGGVCVLVWLGSIASVVCVLRIGRGAIRPRDSLGWSGRSLFHLSHLHAWLASQQPSA